MKRRVLSEGRHDRKGQTVKRDSNITRKRRKNLISKNKRLKNLRKKETAGT